MTGMIERVARAILAEAEVQATCGEDVFREYYNPADMARAAIAAMREPTPEAVVAGKSGWTAWVRGTDHSGENLVRLIFSAMIDAGLAEGPAKAPNEPAKG